MSCRDSFPFQLGLHFQARSSSTAPVDLLPMMMSPEPLIRGEHPVSSLQTAGAQIFLCLVAPVLKQISAADACVRDDRAARVDYRGTYSLQSGG